MFVANCIAEKQTRSQTENWYRIATNRNLADDGMRCSELKQIEQKWFKTRFSFCRCRLLLKHLPVCVTRTQSTAKTITPIVGIKCFSKCTEYRYCQLLVPHQYII